MNRKDALSRIIVKKGDITKEKVDAIVNAANPTLLGGGGVDGAIHRAAGPELLEECRTLRGCNHGEAKITKGYRLPAKFVIHTPGPIYRGGKNNEAQILQNSYKNSMKLAKENNIKTIAFPSISTGVYGYPKEEACKIAVDTVLDFMESQNYDVTVIFIQFDDENYKIYCDYIERLKDELH